VPAEADAGKYEFAAFVNTQVLTPLLEVGPNSIQPVEVSCFSGVMAVSTGSRAATCADTWVGTDNVIIKTPGLPSANITSRSNITWTYDPSISSNGFINYTASGSFDLAFNTPDPGCTITLSPNTFAIVNDPLTPSRLAIIDNGITPPTYSFGGSQLVDFTSTASCPDRDDVVTPFNGFLVPFAVGGGPFAADQVRLFGTSDDGAIESTWDFSRP
jgi:hypothetical protein